MKHKTNSVETYRKETIWHNIRKFWPYYIMVIPGVIYFIIFKYIPLVGSVIAFQDYSIIKGIGASNWVGLENFKKLFSYSDFPRILSNTIILGLCKTVLIFPIPVILSLMLNEVKSLKLKKVIQTVIYIPYFLSWVIVGGIIFDLFGIGGLFNNIRQFFGLKPLLVMQKESWYRPIYVIAAIWKESGWETVVYLATISGLDPSIYEAAAIDGASRFGKIRYITFPLLIPTIVTVFLLNIGNFLELGFDQSFNLLTPMTYSVGDILDTYVYRAGILQAQYSFTTAVGLFQSVIGLVLVMTFNKLSGFVSENGGLW